MLRPPRAHPARPPNEPILSYAPGSPERAALKARSRRWRGERPDVPHVVGGKESREGATYEVRAPHDHALLLATCHDGGHAVTERAIAAALAAAPGLGGDAVRGARAHLHARGRAPRRAVARRCSTPRRCSARARPPTRRRSTRRASSSTFSASTSRSRRGSPSTSRISPPGVPEHARAPPARGLRPRDHAVQLHGHRRQPARRRAR